MKKLIAHHKQQHQKRVAKHKIAHESRIRKIIRTRKVELAGLVGAGICGTALGIATGGLGSGIVAGAVFGAGGFSSAMAEHEADQRQASKDAEFRAYMKRSQNRYKIAK